MATRLIGRHDELGSIEAFLGQVEHDPVALVVSGEPGIGETILCEAMFFRCLLRRGPSSSLRSGARTSRSPPRCS
jgi:hypothetical protein